MSQNNQDLGKVLEGARSQMGKAVGLQSNALDFVFNELSNIILRQQDELKRLNELLAKNEQKPKKSD